MDFIKPKPWPEKDLKGDWLFTYKIDGVRMLRDEAGNPVSRAGKPLYNLDHIDKDITDAEIFDTDWSTSVSLVRTRDGGVPVKRDCIYSINPIEPSLVEGTYTNPTAEVIRNHLSDATARGYEGLVLRSLGIEVQYKVKPYETYDVEVLDTIEGTGKYKGMLGAVVTPMGNVGTGFTDKERDLMWNYIHYWNKIEVKCMSLTKDGKFRHPRYIRERWDK